MKSQAQGGTGTHAHARGGATGARRPAAKPKMQKSARRKRLRQLTPRLSAVLRWLCHSFLNFIHVPYSLPQSHIIITSCQVHPITRASSLSDQSNRLNPAHTTHTNQPRASRRADVSVETPASAPSNPHRNSGSPANWLGCLFSYKSLSRQTETPPRPTPLQNHSTGFTRHYGLPHSRCRIRRLQLRCTTITATASAKPTPVNAT